MGLGRVKTKSDLVAKPSGRQIFAFFCSPHDRRAQNSGCDYTPQSFYTAGSKSEIGHSQRHVGLALKSSVELEVAAGQRWAISQVGAGKAPGFPPRQNVCRNPAHAAMMPS